MEQCRENAPTIIENPKKRRKNAGKGPEHARDGSLKKHLKRPDASAVLRSEKARPKMPENARKAPKSPESLNMVLRCVPNLF